MVLEPFKINDLCKTLLFFNNIFSHLTSQMLVYDSVIYQYTFRVAYFHGRYFFHGHSFFTVQSASSDIYTVTYEQFTKLI